MAACAPPGGGRQSMTPRFTRHLHTLCMPPPSEVCHQLTGKHDFTQQRFMSLLVVHMSVCGADFDYWCGLI